MDLIDSLHQHVSRLHTAADRIDAAAAGGTHGPGPLTAARVLVRLHRLAAAAERLADHLERATGAGRPTP